MELSTERLALRRFTPHELDIFAALYADPRVARYVGGTKTREQAADVFAARVQDYYDRHPGLGIWATIERRTGAAVGCHLLNHMHGESMIQVGYLLFPDYWRRGYATEMARAVVRYGFQDLNLDRIVAITDVAHVVSQRVLLRAGLVRNGERAFSHPAYASQGTLAWFERTAANWSAAQR